MYKFLWQNVWQFNIFNNYSSKYNLNFLALERKKTTKINFLISK